MVWRHLGFSVLPQLTAFASAGWRIGVGFCASPAEVDITSLWSVPQGRLSPIFLPTPSLSCECHGEIHEKEFVDSPGSAVLRFLYSLASLHLALSNLLKILTKILPASLVLLSCSCAQVLPGKPVLKTVSGRAYLSLAFRLVRCPAKFYDGLKKHVSFVQYCVSFVRGRVMLFSAFYTQAEARVSPLSFSLLWLLNFC